MQQGAPSCRKLWRLKNLFPLLPLSHLDERFPKLCFITHPSCLVDGGARGVLAIG